MQVIKIEESKQPALAQKIRKSALGRICIYDPETICSLPDTKLAICRSCPRAAMFIPKNALRALFGHVRSASVMLLKLLNK